MRERDLIDDASRKGWIANLIPHEYVHSWCGKFRRPAGQCTPDFHTPQKTRLLWVYEGLTEYLGEVLMVRSGLVKPEEYRETLASTIGGLMLRTGRKWRSLEDTAVASHLLRDGQPQLERAEAGPGLLLRGRASLARGRRDHPPEDPGSAQPRRFLQEVPGQESLDRGRRSLRPGRGRQAPEGHGRPRLGDVPEEPRRTPARRACRWSWSAGSATASSTPRSRRPTEPVVTAAAPSRPGTRWA